MAKKEIKKGNTKNNTNKKNNVAKKTTTKKVETPKEQKVEIIEEKVVKKVEVEEAKKEVKKNPVKIDKRIFIGIGALLVLIVIVFIIVKCINNPKVKTTKKVKQMGEAFYTEYYYKELSKNKTKKELSNILSKFDEKGIRISINNLSVFNSGIYKEEIEAFKKDYKCDGKKTKVVIYPKKPYGKNDYKIDAEISCEF